jgi:hypothetical protein
MMQAQQAPQMAEALQGLQSPTLAQIVDAGAEALAVDAVSIDPTPNAAAPAPARLSRRPLVTRVSDTAMQRPPDLDDSVLAQSPSPMSILQTRDICRTNGVGFLRRQSLNEAAQRLLDRCGADLDALGQVDEAGDGAQPITPDLLEVEDPGREQIERVAG